MTVEVTTKSSPFEQIDTIKNSLSSFTFGDYPHSKVATIDVSSRDVTDEFSATMNDNGTFTLNGDSSFTWIMDSGTDVGGTPRSQHTLVGTVDNTDGVESLLITPQFEMGASASSDLSCYYVELGFNVPVQDGTDVADWRMMLPNTAEVYKWEDIPTFEARLLHPGFVRKGGEQPENEPLNPLGDTGFIEYDEPQAVLGGSGGSFSWLQIIYFYNIKTKQALLFRTNDNLGTGKVFAFTRSASDNSITLTTRFVPPDNSIGNNGNSDRDFHYGLEIRPMTGDYYDALIYLRERQKAEGHPAFEKGRIVDRPSSGSSDAYPDLARNADAFYAMFGGDRGQVGEILGTSVEQPLGPFDFVSYYNELVRFKEYFEIDDWSMFGVMYGYTDGGLGQGFPQLTPFILNAAEQLSNIHDENIGVLYYTIPIEPSVDGLSSASFGLEDDLSRTRVGYVVEAEPTLDASDQPITIESLTVAKRYGGLLYIMPTWKNYDNSLEYMQFYYNEIADEVDGKFNGFYFDAHNAFCPPPNDNVLDDPEDRGIGALNWTTRNRQLADTMKSDVVTTGDNELVMFTEWPNEYYVSNFDVIGDVAPGVDGFTLPNAQASAILWSEYTGLTNFKSFGAGPLDTLGFGADGFASTGELYCNMYSQYLHLGQIPSFFWFFQLRNTSFIPSPGEEGYDEWFVENIFFYQFLKDVFFTRTDIVRYYRNCRKIRDLPSSQIRANIEFNAGNVPQFSQSYKMHNSVWYDIDNDVICIYLTNWSTSSKNPALVNFTDILTVEDYPELGSTNREVRLLNVNTGETRFLNETGGYDEYAFNLTTQPGDFIVIEMVPEGSTAGFIDVNDVVAEVVNNGGEVKISSLPLCECPPSSYNPEPDRKHNHIDFIDGYPAEQGSFSVDIDDYGFDNPAYSETKRNELRDLLGLPDSVDVEQTPDATTSITDETNEITLHYKAGSGIRVGKNDIERTVWEPHRFDCDFQRYTCEDDQYEDSNATSNNGALPANNIPLVPVGQFLPFNLNEYQNQDGSLDFECDKIDIFSTMILNESIGSCSKLLDGFIPNLLSVNDSISSDAHRTYNDVDPVGSFSNYVDDYGIVHTASWTINGDIIDITFMTQDPRIPGVEEQQGRIKTVGKGLRVFKTGLVTVTRQILRIVDNAYVVVDQSSFQEISEFQASFGCNDNYSDDSPFLHNLNCGIVDELELVVSGTSGTSADYVQSEPDPGEPFEPFADDSEDNGFTILEPSND